jgi:hypothetical protein
VGRRDIGHAWPDTIYRQPTRYRVVVLTSFGDEN